MFCTTCGALLQTGASFCTSCGTRLGATKCPACGKEIRKEACFCVHCGHDLTGTSRASGQSAPPPVRAAAIERQSLRPTVVEPQSQAGGGQSARVQSKPAAQAAVEAQPHSRRWSKAIRVSWIAGVTVLLVGAAIGYLYWTGAIGDRRTTVAASITEELKRYGLRDVSVSVGEDWMATVSGTVVSQEENVQLQQVLESNSQIRGVRYGSFAVKADSSVAEATEVSGPDSTTQSTGSANTIYLGEPPGNATALGLAAARGDLNGVKQLINSGADVNEGFGYKFGTTALMTAASYGHLEAAKLLVSAGAQLEMVSADHGYTALGHAALYGRVDVVRYLLSAGARVAGGRPYDPRPALHAAATGGHLETIQVLLAAGADPTEAQFGESAVDVARSAGHGDAFELLEKAAASRKSSTITSSTGPASPAPIRREVPRSAETSTRQEAEQLITVAPAQASADPASEGFKFYQAGDYTSAAEKFAAAANAGNSRAAGYLGTMYKDGQGVPKDINKAVSLLEQSAKGGELEAAFILGQIYSGSQGIPRNNGIAKQWYETAFTGFSTKASGGDVEAMYWVARLHFSGNGTPVDLEKCVSWLRRASDAGHASATRNLGELYLRGVGVPRDRKEGLRLLRIAAQKSEPIAQEILRSEGKTW